MTKYFKKLRAVIERRAKTLAHSEFEKLKKECQSEIDKAKLRADTAEKKAENDELYYQKRDERRESVYQKKLDYINRLKAKTQNKCKEIIEATNKDCEIKEAKARGYLMRAKEIDTKIQKENTLAEEFYRKASDYYLIINKRALSSESEAHKADELLRKMQ